jgi:hypothetical protein
VHGFLHGQDDGQDNGIDGTVSVSLVCVATSAGAQSNLDKGKAGAGRSIAGQRAWAKIHSATIFRKGTKNAIVHHLLSPTNVAATLAMPRQP